uniref:protein-ribulosamine 3-kinase n=1 Tax=Acrobeloides nanus TaxID=290746 RepID=A0A914DHF8_9BILA
MTDSGPVFIKRNRKEKARLMFDGEYASLEALYATKTIRVPKPVAAFDDGQGGAMFASEYIEMSGLSRYAAELGTQLARLHLYNSELLKASQQRASWFKESSLKPVTKFGFHVPTCCGYIPQNNEWNDNWVDFYTKNKLKQQVDLVLNSKNDQELAELWSQLEPKIPSFFENCGEIVPALVHGDLWSGNVAETDEGPVIFDPASFYGHAEFEFGIATMFGGFPNSFFKAYHEVIPKVQGFEKRLELYQLFHYLNHWNHFGGGYRSSALSIMKRLV